MQTVIGDLRRYFQEVSLKSFIITTLIVSALIAVNYHYHVNRWLMSAPGFIARFAGFYVLFLTVFGVAWVVQARISSAVLPFSNRLVALIFLSPAVFAVKVAIRLSDLGTTLDPFLTVVLQWPLKAVIVVMGVWLLWRVAQAKGPLAGVSTSGFQPRRYLLLLGMMLPLVLLAALKPDFRQVYPKLQMLGASTWWQKVLFELGYGLDFFTIELFFRGFLVLAFIKYAGVRAILPMAAMYCTIHFGKPLAECISSYPGGIILGVIVYHSGSIWGGLIIHLGIAWAMEATGLLL